MAHSKDLELLQKQYRMPLWRPRVKRGIFERVYTTLKEWVLLVRRRAGICVDTQWNQTEQLLWG